MARTRGGSGAGVLVLVRQLHTYVGAFIAPSVLFFACTGSLQLFSLHEKHGDYTPPPLVDMLGRIHKDQVTRGKPKPAAAHAAAAPGERQHHDADDAMGAADHHAAAPDDHTADHHDHAAAPPWSVVALKFTFLTVALGLITSTLLGLWMGLTHVRRRGAVIGLFVAGAVLPVLLLALQG